MLKRFIRSVLLLTLVATLAAVPGVGQAQEGRYVYFEETGHAAVDHFLATWEATPNARSVLGLPISEPFEEESFTNPGEVYRVQYFERAVLEEHPEYRGTEHFVQGRLMGRLLAQGREGEEPFQPVADPGNGSWFAETQHTLSNDPAPFLSYYNNNGGLSVFGYPISEPFQEVNDADGQTYWVQYFERQRMEWHPEQPDPQYQVLLGLLGNEYRDAHHQGNPAFERQPPPAEPSQPAPSQPVDSAPRSTPFIYGYNVTLYYDDAHWQDRQRVLQVAKNSGVYWVRQQISWADLHDISGEIYWGELDEIVADVDEADMNILLTVIHSPSWATANGAHGLPSREHFSTFADFMGRMAARYQGRVQAYEIWNEQNRACENGGDCATAGGIGGQVASADYYVDMLAQVYDSIKANDPNATVVSGAPTSTETNDINIAISDVTFMRQMLNNGNFRADAIGVHPGGQYNPPDAMWPDNPGPGPGWQNSREFYFRRIEDIRQVTVETGKSHLPIWVTEFGWATPNSTPGYEYGNSISFETQADWIARAFEIGRYEYSPWCQAMFLWNLNFSIAWQGANNDPTHEQASFSILNPDWSPRPAWHAIQSIPKN